MADARVISSYCEADWGAHELCPHRFGFGGGPLFGADSKVRHVTLCRCACHGACPIAGIERPIPESEWLDKCECAAASNEKVATLARNERNDDERVRKRLAFAEARDRSDGVEDAELEGVVRAAYERHGLEADDRQYELLADVLRASRVSRALQPLHVARILGKAFAPAVRLIGDAIRENRRRPNDG